MSLVSEYFNYCEEYSKKYGEKTIVLIQVGSFYETYSVKNNKENIGHAVVLSQLLHSKLTRKNTKIQEVNRKNPYMAGFPVTTLDDHLHILLENNYTVVTIDQVTAPPNPERKVTYVYSPGTVINDQVFNTYITVVLIEKVKNKDLYLIGLSTIDISTAQTVLYEFSSDKKIIIDNIYSFLKCYLPKEIIIYNKTPDVSNELLISLLELDDILIHFYNEIPSEYSTLNFQNDYLSKIYNNENSMIDIIHLLDLEGKLHSIISFLLLLDFIYKHNETMLQNLNKPVFYNPNTFLFLMTNTIDQLDIFENKYNKSKLRYKSVFDVINKTITFIGKRKLKSDLLFPIKNIDILNERYDVIENISNLQKESLIILEKNLSEILDIEKLHRKMSIGKLNPCDFLTLDIAYKSVLNISYELNEIYIFNESELLSNYIAKYTDLFNLEEMSEYKLENIGSCFFNLHKFPEIDHLSNEYSNKKTQLENIARKYSLLINDDPNLIKVSYIEKEGYFLLTTNIRANFLKKSQSINLNNITFISNKSGVRIVSKEIQKLSNELISIQNKIKFSVKELYIECIKNFYNEHCSLLRNIVNYIGHVDVYLSNFKVKQEYTYSRPTLIKNIDYSFVEINELRHPLVERIHDSVKYISNDISFNNNGIILYGLNFAGKSTLIKSIGIAIILAQAGMFVPCKTMNLSPYNTLITRLQGNDNILKGQSSFVVEMLELRNILKNANQNTMIIMDELCRGTETISANAIVASSLLQLNKSKCDFILATHLRFLSEYQPIKNNENILIKHLSIKYCNSDIIFDRKLKDGVCNELYGIEICKYLGLDTDFIDKTMSIRDQLIGKKNKVLSTKKSKYNSKKLIDSCEICNYFPNKNTDLPLDIHHILFQCDADLHGKIDTIHKNDLHNLVCLCKSCHQNTHNGNIIINGYVTTNKGIILDFSIINKFK